MKILIIDDDKIQLKYLAQFLNSIDHDVVSLSDGKELEKILDNENIDVVISDYKLGDENGLVLLKKIKKINSEIEVIIITAFGSIEDAVLAMKLGAYGYLNKPVNFDELELMLEKIEVKKNMEDKLAYISSSAEEGKELVFCSDEMKNVIENAKKAAFSDVTVLIEGETGTGKEMIADFIHKVGIFHKKPMIKIFCAAIPDNLIESELFGYKKGAFTGAEKDKKGKFEYADGGIVFLDEISEIPVSIQTKLLRVIQEKKIEAIGDNSAKKLNVKIIAATNRDLKNEIREGRFREDLYYRLNVFNLKIPPLRERKKDIKCLTEYFLNKYNKKYGKEISLTDDEFAILNRYNWPGNVRELENFIINWILTDKINLKTLFINDTMEIMEGDLTLKDVEKIYIENMLRKCNGNRSEAAKRLGIHRNTLAKYIKEYDIDLTFFK